MLPMLRRTPELHDGGQGYGRRVLWKFYLIDTLFAPNNTAASGTAVIVCDGGFAL